MKIQYQKTEQGIGINVCPKYSTVTIGSIYCQNKCSDHKSIDKTKLEVDCNYMNKIREGNSNGI